MAVPTIIMGTGGEGTLAWPASYAVDDWLYLACEHSSGTATTPSGMSIAPGFPVTHNGGSTMLSLFRVKATSLSMAAPSAVGGTNHTYGVPFAVRGAHATEPQMAVATSQGTGASVNGYAPGLVTDRDNALVVAILAWATDATGPLSSGEANASLTSVTEVFDGGTVTNDGGGLTIITGTKATAGAVSATTCTLTSSSFCSATIAFREADPANAYDVEGTARVNGAAVADGGIVQVWDDVLGVRVATHTIASGNGTYSIPVPYNDANRYIVYFNNGTNFGASPKGTAS